MRARSILSGVLTLALAVAIAGAPARPLTDSIAGRGAGLGVTLRVESRSSAALVGTTNGTPDADLRPGDERDPAPPLPGSAVDPLLLIGAAALAFLVLFRGDRLIRTRRFGPHAPRGPPASVTV